MRYIVLCMLFLVSFLHGEDNMDSQKWISVKDSKEDVELSFPHPPIHMLFELPIEGSEQQGNLNVYTAPIEKGIFMLSILSSPQYKGDELDEDHFQQLFYSTLIQRMFYNPQDFKNHQLFTQEELDLNGYHGLSYSATFDEHDTPKKLSGIAIQRGQKLYILFYLASEKDFDDALLRRFIESFHFLEINA